MLKKRPLGALSSSERRINIHYDKKQELINYLKANGGPEDVRAFILDAIEEKWANERKKQNK